MHYGSTNVKRILYALYSFIEDLSTALAKDHAKGDISMVTELVNLCAIV